MELKYTNSNDKIVSRKKLNSIIFFIFLKIDLKNESFKLFPNRRMMLSLLEK